MWYMPWLREIKSYRGWHTSFKRKSNIYWERRDLLFKEQGVLFSFKNTFLRKKSKVLYQVFFPFDMEIPTFHNFRLESFTVY